MQRMWAQKRPLTFVEIGPGVRPCEANLYQIGTFSNLRAAYAPIQVKIRTAKRTTRHAKFHVNWRNESADNKAHKYRRKRFSIGRPSAILDLL